MNRKLIELGEQYLNDIPSTETFTIFRKCMELGLLDREAIVAEVGAYVYHSIGDTLYINHQKELSVDNLMAFLDNRAIE